MTAKVKIRQQILSNNLELPNIKGLQVTAECNKFFKALWHAYITSGQRTTENGIVTNTVSLPYWAQRIANPKLMNILLKILSDSGWITVSTRPNNNWSEAYLNESKLLKYCTQEELDHTRIHYKLRKYKLELHVEQNLGATKTKAKGRIFNSGLIRNGFAASGFVKYQFDTSMMSEYKDFVVKQINKGIEKMIVQYPQITEDHANYKELGIEIVDSYICHKEQYNAGPRTSDPRGRNNRGDLNKIGNPVGFKIMRALLVIPEEYRQTATKEGLTNKYLFIAELMGFKTGAIEEKISFGRKCYWANTLHTGTKESEIIENIWAIRTYEDIDNAFNSPFTNIFKRRAMKKQFNFEDPELTAYKWCVPIEIDMSALTY